MNKNKGINRSEKEKEKRKKKEYFSGLSCGLLKFVKSHFITFFQKVSRLISTWTSRSKTFNPELKIAGFTKHVGSN